MNDEIDDKLSEQMPDRPLECSGCKKPVTVFYTEIVGKNINRICMCADCPELQKRLRGVSLKAEGGLLGEAGTGLACGNCGTTLEAVRMGSSLGCSNCYEVFADVLVKELAAAARLPSRLVASGKKGLFHIGRAPGEAQELNVSLRLVSLNEALTETLKREDYEQAAQLRDQIRQLTDQAEKEGGKDE